MVASTRSGMVFMDWPTSNGLIWPGLDKWIHQKDMFWEHIHRLIAEGVGYLGDLHIDLVIFCSRQKIYKASPYFFDSHHSSGDFWRFNS